MHNCQSNGLTRNFIVQRYLLIKKICNNNSSKINLSFIPQAVPMAISNSNKQLLLKWEALIRAVPNKWHNLHIRTYTLLQAKFKMLNSSNRTQVPASFQVNSTANHQCLSQVWVNKIQSLSKCRMKILSIHAGLIYRLIMIKNFKLLAAW